MKNSERKKSGNGVLVGILIGVLVLVAGLMAAVLVVSIRNGGRRPAGVSGVVASTTAAAATAESTMPATEATTEMTTEAPTEPPLSPEEQAVRDVLNSMTLEEKLCQLFVVTPESLSGVRGVQEADEAVRAGLAAYPVGGVILFGANIYSESQVTAFLSGMQDAAKTPLLVGVDEEGGIVSRLSGAGITRYYDSMGVYGSEGAVDRVEEIGGEIASDVRRVGFNVDFAPVADVVTNPNNTEIGIRSFSSDPAVAATMVRAMVRGLQNGGCASCLKHFPGMGSTEANSHTGTSVSPRTLDELRQTELLPFAAGIDEGAAMVMVTHMSLPNVLGDETPCDLAPEIVTDLLREELGFEGVVITDSHEMASITDHYTPGEAALLALQAGCDIVLMPNDLSEAVAALETAIRQGDLTEARVDESVTRILTLKYRLGLLE